MWWYSYIKCCYSVQKLPGSAVCVCVCLCIGKKPDCIVTWPVLQPGRAVQYIIIRQVSRDPCSILPHTGVTRQREGHSPDFNPSFTSPLGMKCPGRAEANYVVSLSILTPEVGTACRPWAQIKSLWKGWMQLFLTGAAPGQVGQQRKGALVPSRSH